MLPDPIPIVLLPGLEYRLREWRHPEYYESHWLLERRKPPGRAAATSSPCRSTGDGDDRLAPMLQLVTHSAEPLELDHSLGSSLTLLKPELAL